MIIEAPNGPAELRAKARQCIRLASAILDEPARKALTQLAAEFEEKAAALDLRKSSSN